MATSPRRYVMLMSSLPYHGRLFERTRTPVSRAVLERRLGLMEAGDRALLDTVEEVVDWAAIDASLSDGEMIGRADGLLARLRAAGARDLHDAVRHRMELRTAVAALRRRHRGAPAPGAEGWGVGRWTARIAARWGERDLGLGRVFPWIAAAQGHLEADDPLALERLLLGRAWADLGERGARHRFDLTAVVFYVLRWNMVDRWTRMDADAARARFDALVAAARAAHGDPLPERAARG